MAGANTNVQITDLDFDTIKNNLKTFLKSQDTLKDYNYEGSALAVLLDLLSYNTQYNAYYLNMVANEMFLDSAIQRDSVISQAKILNYTPRSAVAPTATITLTVNQVTSASLTLPKYATFLSEAIDGINYAFVTPESHTVNVVNNVATFSNINIKQGVSSGISYTVNSTQNPSYTFKIPDVNVDTSTLQVTIQQSSTNTSIQTFTRATDVLNLDETSPVYFLQEGLGGHYEVYFGNGLIGKKLTDGNIVQLSYLTTSGTSAYGANSFVIMAPVGGFSNTSITPITSATAGSTKESINSIKFQAPKSYAAQGRAVTKEDYITAMQQNNLGITFDAVNVWGGQENDPPVYGQVFISAKPNGGYTFTDVQKQKLLDLVIKPISVMTVQPTFVDPDYTYIQITANVLYDPKKTTLSSGQLQASIKNAISSYSVQSLNTFNSTFSVTDFNDIVKNVDSSIIANEINIQVQKKIYPNLTIPSTYTLHYGTSLKKGLFQTGISSSPSMLFRNPINLAETISGVYIEEVPSSTGGVESILITNPGFSYQYAPTVTIKGDGTGATATAEINSNGVLKAINITNAGSGYTSAIAVITPQYNDNTGQQGAAVVILTGRYGTLRTYYNNTDNVKTVFNNNAGTVDYEMGVVTLNSLGALNVDNPLGQLTITANPTTTIVSSSYNRIITVDPFDPGAIAVNLTAKT
jgi:hypothetical protein